MIFLTSRNDNHYKLLNNIFANKFYRNKISKKKIVYFEIMKKHDFSFFLDLIKKFLTLKILNKQDIAKLEFYGANYGRYLLSVIYKDIRSYDSNILFLYNFLKNLIFVSRHYFTSKKLIENKKIAAIYLDHCMYLNGILFETLIKRKKTIYLNNYPKDLLEVKPCKKKISIEDCFKIYNDKKKITKTNVIKIKKLQSQIVKGERIFYPWMMDTKFKKSKLKNLNKYNYIIYTHSFADAQLNWGYDDFVNAYEWLDFTIKNLSKKDQYVLVKAHPNFFLKQKKYQHYVKRERHLFKSIVSKYKYNNKIEFLNLSVDNRYIMSKLNKNCIAITHHGSVGLELLLNNFKVISSVCNFYDKNFKLSNQWSNYKEYKKLLNLNWSDLNYHNKNDLLKICKELFLNDVGYLSKNYHMNILRNYMINKKIITKKTSLQDISMKFNNLKNKEEIAKLVNFPITTIKLN